MKCQKMLAGALATAMVIPTFAVNVFAATSVPLDEEHFPNKALRERVANYDKDSDGELSSTEIKAITDFSLHGGDCTDLTGLEYLTAITDLYLGGPEFKEINLSKLKNLKNISFYDCDSFTELDFSKNYYLETINLDGCDSFETFKFDNNAHITKIVINSCASIEAVDFSSLESLAKVWLYNDDSLESVNITNCKKLASLTCYNTAVRDIELKGCSGLEYLDAYDNRITSIDLSYCSILYSADLHNNDLKEINLSNSHPKLKILDVKNNFLEEINISTCEAILEIYNSEGITNADNKYNRIGYRMHYDADTKLIVDSPVVTIPTPTPTLKATATPKPTATPAPIATAKPTATPKPVATAVPTAKPTATVAPTAKPTKAPEGNKGTENFADRLYTEALDRDADEAGVKYWVEQLSNGTPGSDVAYGFIFSDEVKNSGISDAEFVKRLYGTLMGRVPSDEETKYWVDYLKSGHSAVDVFYGFVNSVEWANICLTYGIVSGSTTQPTITIEPTDDIIAFATRLYTTCLGRNPDKDGLDYWANALANRKVTGTEAALLYFFSPEYLDAKHTDDEFVTSLYLTFMDRDPESDGYTYWMGELKKGASREDVFYGFSGSPEFGLICAKYGIIR